MTKVRVWYLGDRYHIAIEDVEMPWTPKLDLIAGAAYRASLKGQDPEVAMTREMERIERMERPSP